MIYIIGTLLLIGVILIFQPFIKLKRLKAPASNHSHHPIVEEEIHLFAERPHHNKEEIAKQKNNMKTIVITEMMLNGSITFSRADELGVKRLAGVIFRLRKHYKIDNVIVDGKFSHYKLIKYKGN